MALKEIIFKITIASRLDIPLTTTQIREYPTHEMYIAEYQEKLLSIMYNPADGFNEENFISSMKLKFQLLYKTENVEKLERTIKLK